ncbi:ABC transporter substrate-binding protein [Niveispirillum lacus]|uniref:ABC transporter substrate-binding protein n=1 Tax=Niveispirillum lacus TaxID=1981099 RepID=UPI0013FDB3BF|nr:ABC transporter substrate-binding protein [Niveispirillum lacus]
MEGRAIIRTHVLILVSILMLTGMARSASAAEQLVAAISGQVAADDPHESRTGADFQYYDHIYDTLVTRDGFDVIPRLARSWSTQDHQSWSFQIDPAARFADNRPVTPRDVIYSLCRYQVLTRRMGREMLGLTHLSAEAGGRVSLTLSAPYRLLPSALSLVFIMAAPDDTGEGPQGCDPATVLAGRGKAHIGSGPYKPAPREATALPDQHVLIPSAHCWRNCAAWPRVVLWSAPDARDRLRLLVTGQADIMEDVIPVHLPYISKLKGMTLTELPTDRTLLLTFNLRPKSAGGKPNPVADIRVRQAIAMALDRHVLVERGLEGFAGPAWQLAQPGMEGYLADRPQTMRPDPDQARALLAEAGYGQGLDLTLLLPLTRITDRPRVADALAGMLRAIGITLTITPVPASESRARVAKGDFQVMFAGLGLTAGSAMEGYAAVAGAAEKDSIANPSGYRNAILDNLLHQARGADPSSIPVLTRQATAILDADLPMIPLMHIRDLVAHRAGLSLHARDTTRAFGRITSPAMADASDGP